MMDSEVDQPVPIDTSSNASVPSCGADMGDAGQAAPIDTVGTRGTSCVASVDNDADIERHEGDDPTIAFEHDEHNRQVAALTGHLGMTGEGRRAVIRAVAERQGITEDDELEKMFDGRSTSKLRVPIEMREVMRDIGLGDLLVPVKLVTVQETAGILVNTEQWKDLEFEVALDSCSVVHMCSIHDCPGYRVAE